MPDGEIFTQVALELHGIYAGLPSDNPRPDQGKIIEIIGELREILFPRHFGDPENGRNPVCLAEKLGSLFWNLARQIHDTVTHGCPWSCSEGCDLFQVSQEKAAAFIRELPAVRRALDLDVQAAYDGDPAAKGLDEVILSYPGVFAIMVYRLAHVLHRLEVPLIPRMMTEYAHSLTGIDIHPGARIGASFFIDHGTGVVIGETCEIGDNVKIYQGVTLGALSFPKDQEGNLVRNQKRHPTIEDDVTIYSGATILGGGTVIGKGSVVGGNVWLTKSIPPGSKVVSRPVHEQTQVAL